MSKPRRQSSNTDFAHQPGEIPATAGDVLPMYQQPPTFADFMGEEQITIELDVIEPALTLICGQTERRRTHASQTVRCNLTSHHYCTSHHERTCLACDHRRKSGDGPTPDDLVGGMTEALIFDGTDMSLSYTLKQMMLSCALPGSLRLWVLMDLIER